MTRTQRAVSEAVKTQVPTLVVSILLVVAYLAGGMMCEQHCPCDFRSEDVRQ